MSYEPEMEEFVGTMREDEETAGDPQQHVYGQAHVSAGVGI